MSDISNIKLSFKIQVSVIKSIFISFNSNAEKYNLFKLRENHIGFFNFIKIVFNFKIDFLLLTLDTLITFIELFYCFRFRHGYCRHNPRKMVRLWAEKEMRNLTRMYSAGLPVPKPILLRSHVLMMSFIGKDGWPAPKLKVIAKLF